MAKGEWVNVLLCTTQRANHHPNPPKSASTDADGLWLVEKAKLTKKRGAVATIRRRLIVDKINASRGWS